MDISSGYNQMCQSDSGILDNSVGILKISRMEHKANDLGRAGKAKNKEELLKIKKKSKVWVIIAK